MQNVGFQYLDLCLFIPTRRSFSKWINLKQVSLHVKSLGCLQMQQWFNIEGERHLLEAESVEDSGDRMEHILNTFTGFLIEANVSVFFFF